MNRRDAPGIPAIRRRYEWRFPRYAGARVSLLQIAALLLVAAGCAADPHPPANDPHPPANDPYPPANDPDEREWIPLFNGQDLTGWDVKFSGYNLNENLNNTFRVEDGLLKVRYDNWDGFNGEFGHIFYEQPFSHYLVAIEYRFVGEQVTGAGPDLSWAVRNNGIMLHCQSAQSMGKDQDFPISIEVQLLGGLGTGERSTANLCTPGTNVVMEGELFTPHCVGSTSRTYAGDQWVRVEALVLGDSLVKHIVEGDTVLQYTRPQMGGGAVSDFDPSLYREGKLLSEGFIALQAETAPVDFRKVELLNLVGCTDADAANYKSYYVESNPDACRYETDGR